jgi:hypothetical protein
MATSSVDRTWCVGHDLRGPVLARYDSLAKYPFTLPADGKEQLSANG